MKKKQFNEFNQLLVTNSISTDSLYWHELDAFIANPTEIPPIIVVGVLLDGSTRYLVLDGNHRAVKCAVHCIRVPALALTSTKDLDRLLAMETEGLIPPFPHRRVFSGIERLDHLISRALWTAGRECQMRSVEECAHEIGKGPSAG